VADVAADVDGIVTTDGTRGGGKRVGGTKDACEVLVVNTMFCWGECTAAGLAGVTALPDHGDDRTAEHVCGNVSVGVFGRAALLLQVTRPLKKGLSERSS
jgi:hypothetical protein